MNPLAVQALAERGIVTTGHFSKGVGDVPLDRVDTVITLCEEEVCPNLPERTRHLHWPMPDPALAEGSQEEQLASFCRTRDLIEERLHGWLPPGDRNSAIA